VGFLLRVNNAVVTRLELQDLFSHISGLLKEVVPHEYLILSIWNPEKRELRVKFAVSRAKDTRDLEDFLLPLEISASGQAVVSGVSRLFNMEEIEKTEGAYRQVLSHHIVRSLCAVPLQTARGKLGAVAVASSRERAYSPDLISVLDQVADQLAIALENALAYNEMEELNRRLKEAKLYLEEELQESATSDEILGASPGIRKVLQQIETVAATDATVLIYGDTGSGKELVARALHQRSQRSRGTFVKLNCAAIPTGLLESDLFGHERGAFTGAIAQKIGRFEIAHGGTLFLDEIGEIPLELQPKLLRVLQEKEFERLGSTRTLRTDARLVAATNRDLKKMAESNQFRSDLYYRLNVFPITVPPLRERREDIPLLAMHFTREYARRLGKNILSIPSDAVETLVRYHWPGNIRELQNLIERSVILTNGETLRIPLQELETNGLPATETPSAALGTMEEVERQTILRALLEANGVVGGPKGAAAKLGMKRTTLLYRMDKLGIANPK
jgi:formate hydrogenlyase transcriptional activator